MSSRAGSALVCSAVKTLYAEAVEQNCVTIVSGDIFCHEPDQVPRLINCDWFRLRLRQYLKLSSIFDTRVITLNCFFNMPPTSRSSTLSSYPIAKPSGVLVHSSQRVDNSVLSYEIRRAHSWVDNLSSTLWCTTAKITTTPKASVPCNWEHSSYRADGLEKTLWSE